MHALEVAVSATDLQANLVMLLVIAIGVLMSIRRPPIRCHRFRPSPVNPWRRQP